MLSPRVVQLPLDRPVRCQARISDRAILDTTTGPSFCQLWLRLYRKFLRLFGKITQADANMSQRRFSLQDRPLLPQRTQHRRNRQGGGDGGEALGFTAQIRAIWRRAAPLARATSS
jgi:hypothetical protein